MKMPQWCGRGKPSAVTNKGAKARHATMTHDPDRAPPGRGGGERRAAKGAAVPAVKSDAAAERRAAQLRENLHRRKRQRRLRHAGPD